VLVRAAAVGAVGVPVSAGLAFGARRASAVSAREVSVLTAEVAKLSAVDWAVDACPAAYVSAVDCAVAAAPAASKALLGCVAALPSPRFVRAVAAFPRSDRFADFCAASPSAVSALLVSVATADVANVSAVVWAVLADPAASNAEDA